MPARGDQAAEESGVVAGSGPGLQNLVAGPRTELLQLGGHDGRRGDTGDHLVVLVALDRHSVVDVGDLDIGVRDEGVPLDGAESRDDLGSAQMAGSGERGHQGFAALGGIGGRDDGGLHAVEVMGGGRGNAGEHGGGRVDVEGCVVAEPGECRLLVRRGAGAVEREDRVVGEDGAQPPRQAAVGGKPRQVAPGSVERGDALSPAGFCGIPLRGVGVHQPPHPGDRRGAASRVGWVDLRAERGQARPHVPDLEGVEASGSVHRGQQQDAPFPCSRVAGLGEGERAVGAEEVVCQHHAGRAAECLGLGLVHAADPERGKLVGDEVVEDLVSGVYGAQPELSLLTQEVPTLPCQPLP